jgi:hypothetical protein
MHSRFSQPDLYLLATIARHRLPESAHSVPSAFRRRLLPLLRRWAGPHLESVSLSGSYAKGTALRGPSLLPSDLDIDLFLSLSPDTPGPLDRLHHSLAHVFRDFSPQPRNVSLRIRLDDTNLDLVPARRHPHSSDHTLWQLRRSTWLRTNIQEQIRFVRRSGFLDQILALKIWRRRHALRFPSFYLELAVIHALSHSDPLSPSAAFLHLLHFLSSDFPSTTLTDPANSSNLLSDLLSPPEKLAIAQTARASLSSPTWPQIL